jgi:VPDSG-CTERM motif
MMIASKGQVAGQSNKGIERNSNMINKVALATIVLALSMKAAFAINYQVDASNSGVVANTGTGLIIDTSLASGLSSVAFSLNDQQSQTFNFFNIWTPETWVNSGEDTVPQSITATLAFNPPVSSAVLGGTTVGVSIFGIFQFGSVAWDPQSTIIDLGNGESFSVTLSDEFFSAGFFGLNNNPCAGATVKATVTQLSSSGASTVPDGGSTIILLGAALSGMGMWSRRFKK